MNTIMSLQPPLLSSIEMEERINQIIEISNLTPPNNLFFKNAKELKKSIAPGSAIYIAYNWREITKNFMFTTIVGVGNMAALVNQQSSPSYNLLNAIQTIHRVIGDDLNNVIAEFSDIAPKGVGGIHYIWWNESILNKILENYPNLTANRYLIISEKAKLLIQGMNELVKSPIGTAVQLRIVEAIALNIAIAFRKIFAKVAIDTKKIFPKREDLSWINSHIKAEVNHNRQVSDTDVGMASLAITEMMQADMLEKVKYYAELWRQVLDDFAAITTKYEWDPLKHKMLNTHD